jgi:hypothetical protein
MVRYYLWISSWDKRYYHTYLGMDMHFNNKKLQVSMAGYLHGIIDEFPFEIMG